MASTDTRQIPIDIHLGQLLDWLISRRHCNKDWHSSLQNVRGRAEKPYALILDEEETWRNVLVENKISQSATDFLFSDCKAILNILLSSEKHSATNLLGQYQSQLTKDFADVLKMYEKDNVYLAEMASFLHRTITYDIPFLRKRMQKLDQMSDEFSKKSEDCIRTANDFREQYLKDCAALGIQGKNVHDELLQEAQALPKIYENIATHVTSLEEICNCVEEFVNGVHLGGKIMDQSGQTLFPLLRHLIQHGNTAYPITEADPMASSTANADVMNMDLASRTRVRRLSGSSQTSLSVNLNDTIGDHLNELNSPPHPARSSGEDEAIDFEIVDVTEESTDVNWDIDTGEFQIVVQAGGSNAGGILDNPEFRTQIVNELHEILAFLRRRAGEQTSEHMASDLLNIQVGALPLMNDRKLTQQLIGSVREIIGLFEDHRLQSLCKLHDSATFLDRLTKQLEQKLIFCDRMERRAEAFKVSRLEAIAERERLNPELSSLIEKTRVIQRFIEQDISKKYQERRVQILGGVQSIA